MSEDRKYVHVSRDTVHLFAEQAGITDVKDEVCGMVAEDCGYRLREATALAAQFMRNNRRKKLTTEDFNKALLSYDVEPILGYGAGRLLFAPSFSFFLSFFFCRFSFFLPFFLSSFSPS